MGKVYKRKRRSCAVCKPHKVGWEPKRTGKQEERLKADEDEMREATK
jgi:hypothetical protein